jgi:hypothetical protein
MKGSRERKEQKGGKERGGKGWGRKSKRWRYE